MSHTYPLATDARDALDPARPAARTRREAELAAGEDEVVALETGWLEVDANEAAMLLDMADKGQACGFVQPYEDEQGRPVLAVTFWKLAADDVHSPEVAHQATRPVGEDHTDDLYFREGRTRRRRASKGDSRQLDLFPDADPEGS